MLFGFDVTFGSFHLELPGYCVQILVLDFELIEVVLESMDFVIFVFEAFLIHGVFLPCDCQVLFELEYFRSGLLI